MSMELIHPPSTSVAHIPSMSFPQHRALTMPSLAPINSKMKRKKENMNSNLIPSSFNFYLLPSAVNNFVCVRCHASNSLVTRSAEPQFRSTFDDYLKEMESIRARRIEEEKKEKEKKGQISKRGDISSGDAEEDDAFQSEDVGIRSRAHRDGLKLDGNQFIVDSPRRDAIDEVRERKRGTLRRVKGEMSKVVSVNRKKVGMREIDEIGRTKGDKGGLYSTELVDEGMYDGRRITKMEMEERIQKLARSLNGADINMPEWMFSKMMREAQIRFSDHSVLRVIQVLGNLGNWRRVLQVIEWLEMRERFKSHKLKFIYTAALDVLGKAKRPVEALNLYHKMQKQRSTYPDIVAYHCIAVILGQAGHMKELFDTMDSMRKIPEKIKMKVIDNWEPRLEPDIVIYNAVLNACVKRKQWEGAFWVLQQLKQGGLQPSSTTYGLVMEVMMACGKYSLVHDFFKKVQRSSIPNALTYRVVMNAFWKEGRTDEAIGVVKEMERRGIIGSASVYYDLARCLCSVGRCEEALEQIGKMCKVASKPLVVSYTGLIQSCLETGRVKDAAYIFFTHMPKHCTPNLVTCNITLRGLVEHNMLDEAKDLFLGMLQKEENRRRGATADIYTFNTILEAFVVNKRWSDFEYAYEEMLRHGHHFSTKRHQWMVIRCSQEGKIGGPVEATWKHFMKRDQIPSPVLLKERFLLKLESDDLLAALSTATGISHSCHASSSPRKAFSMGAWLELLGRVNKLESVEKLMSQIEIHLSHSQELILQNLVEACRELMKQRIASPTPFDTKCT